MLGICLGMQLLFKKSYEQGISNGLALLDGEIEKISNISTSNSIKVPHIGWNSLVINNQNMNPLSTFPPGPLVWLLWGKNAKKCKQNRTTFCLHFFGPKCWPIGAQSGQKHYKEMYET